MERFKKMVYRIQDKEQRNSIIPPFIIDKMRRQEEEKTRYYDDRKPQPSVYDDYQHRPDPIPKQDEERGIVNIDIDNSTLHNDINNGIHVMTVTSSMPLLEYIL